MVIDHQGLEHEFLIKDNRGYYYDQYSDSHPVDSDMTAFYMNQMGPK